MGGPERPGAVGAACSLWQTRPGGRGTNCLSGPGLGPKGKSWVYEKIMQTGICWHTTSLSVPNTACVSTA